MAFMVLGPLHLILRLSGISVGADADDHYWLVFIPALILIAAASEIFISRLATGMGPGDEPSLSDWLVFWGLPAAGPVLFLFSSV